jgi:hypothetical protein
MHMHDNDCAVYRESGLYTKAETKPAVFFGKLRDGANIPDLAVAITLYNTDPDVFTVQTNPLVFLQLRFRGTTDDRVVIDWAHQAFELLHTLTPGRWPGNVSPLSVTRTIDGLPEPDANSRWTKADSYAVRLNP